MQVTNKQPRRNSLLWRLVFASLIILPLMLGVIAFALHNAFKASLLNAEKNALMSHFYSLLAVAEPSDTALELPSTLGQPRFNQFESGLYSWISDKDNNIVWRSPSDKLTHFSKGEWLNDKNHPILSHLSNDIAKVGSDRFGQVDNENYFIYQYTTVWALDNTDKTFTFTIAHSGEMMNRELAIFHKTLALWLGLLGAIIVLSQIIIFNWGLKPLGRLANQIKRLEKGQTSEIKGQYPNEISPIVSNLNHLLEHEKSQRKRYKNTLSDLAHSLKTPLALIRTLLSNETLSKPAIDEQITRMSDIIDHQLRRASSVSANVKGTPQLTEFSHLVDRLTASLSKVYFEKQVHVVNHISNPLSHSIDQHDAMELLGNILENAFKYCSAQVEISALSIDDCLQITVSDDGPGIGAQLHESILKRGARVDTATPGQGIGLAISIDILSSYDGSLTCTESPLGGAQFTIMLPVSTHA